jgi:hypothetical protein
MYDVTKCMSRKNKKVDILVQCPYPRKIGDLCKKHHNSKHLLRIDHPIPAKKSRNKPLIILESSDDDIASVENIEIMGLENIELSGPAYHDICLSNDDVDPVSQEVLWTMVDGLRIPQCEFQQDLIFSYTDNSGFIRCFNINSLIGMFEQNIFNHPITGEQFDTLIIAKVHAKYKILQQLHIIHPKLVDNSITTDSITLMAFNTLHKLSKFNIYINDQWFLELSTHELHKLYYETQDFFKQNIPPTHQHKIFNKTTTQIKNYSSPLIIQHEILSNYDKLLNVQNEQMLTLGSYIIVGGLATVCPEVKTCYPDIAFSFME